jgi:hypothetical protein
MTKKFTFKNSKVLGYLLILLGLFGSSAYNLSQAQAPYCSATSTNSPCSSWNMYVGSVRVAQGSNVIFNKANDGCNTTSGGYTLMSTTPSFTLNGGSTYTMSFNTGPSYPVHMGVWIDLNRDNDFGDAGEFLSGSWADISNGVTNIQARTAYVGCNGISAGTSRMRVRSEYYNQANFSAGSSCSSIYYGETEDYTITLATSTSLAAGFYMPTTAFEGTPVKMTNNNQTGYIKHEWDIADNGSVEYNTTNANHIFTTLGTNCVRLKSQNCLGRDSILKCINIIAPTAKPVVDFASNTNEVERYGTINFLDLSTNGPTYWSWYMYDPADSIATRQDVETFNSNLVGNNPFVNANPNVFFNRTGNYTVCLQTSNSQGPSSLLCKKNHIRVTPFKDNNMGAGTVQPIFEASGNIIDDGGRTANYSNNRVDYATIIPCSAKKITLKFSQFKVAAGDLLKIYDGTNAAGVPLHPGNGFTAGNVPTGPIVANSGAMYLYFSTNGTGVDSGFIASWTTEKGIAAAPIASFTIPDTLYNPINYTYVNTSQNVLGKTDYIWDIQGFGEVGYAKDLDFAIYTDNTYDVTMSASTCVGSSSFTKTVVVVTPHTKAEVDFKADNRRPTTGETVTITPFHPQANKAIKTDSYKWTFFPSTVSVVSQDPYTGAIKVKFNAKGKFTASLRAWNSLDSAATSADIIKADYVIVVEHCTPLLGVSASTDVAINNVRLANSKGTYLIDNTTTSNSQGYEDYTLNDNISATITYGATYNVSTYRSTNVNPMSRKVWIDWNIDGDFDDAFELIASEATATTTAFNQNFTVPNNTVAFEGKTRMRVGTSYSNDPNMPCGAASGINNANRIGEFEDYRIFITNDNTAPALTLTGDDTLYLEVGTTYTEYGAVAIDPTEGDISSKIVITSDVDMGFTGVYYLQYNVKDAGGNPAIPVNRVVYVVKDQTAPVITLNGNDTVRIEVYSPYNEDGAKANDNKDGNITNAIVIDGAVNTSVLGTYILTYKVNDISGNASSKNRVVIVGDSEKPVINNTDADVNNEVKVQILSIFIDRTRVTDNYDNMEQKLDATNGPGTIDGVDTRFQGTYQMVYNAMDISGNKADTKTYKYIVDDYVGPTITLNTLDTIVWPVNKAYVPVQASISDNYYNISEVSLTKTSNVNPFKLGIYSDVYTATDGSGNVTIRNRWVRVVDDVAPIINGSSMNVGLFSNIDASEGLTFTDNYDAPTSLRPRLVVLSNNLNTYAEGLYSVTFQVSDLSGNLSAPYERLIWVNRMFPTIQGSVASIGKDKTVNVYPNPSTGLVNISYNFATPETMDVKVYNATGSLVAEINSIHGQNGVQSIDLSSQANGLYHVSMIVAGKQINRTISINK